MPFIQTRQRVISRSTPILDFTGIATIRNGVFDATTLVADSFGRFTLLSGTILTKSTSDPTKVKAYAGLGTNLNEQQTITVTGTPTGGYLTLTFGGQTTPTTGTTITYAATAAQVATALQLLTSIGQGNLTATGGPLPGTAVVVTFTNELGNAAQAAMTASAAGLTGGTTPAVAVTRSTPGTTGEAIFGIYAGVDKDFFGNTVSCDEPIPVHQAYTVFDTTLIQNWGEYGELCIQQLPLCQFVGA
jgi:hypothetical protein